MPSAAAAVSVDAHANAGADCHRYSDSADHTRNFGRADGPVGFTSPAVTHGIIEHTSSFRTARQGRL
jgi:hypothetical protein